MVESPGAGPCWFVAFDGDASSCGSTGAIHLAQPIVAMPPMPTGGGYPFSAADGGLSNTGRRPSTAGESGRGVGTGLGHVMDMASDGGFAAILIDPDLDHPQQPTPTKDSFFDDMPLFLGDPSCRHPDG
jgi:hypothetical protein